MQINLVRMGYLIWSVYRLPCDQWGSRQTTMNRDWPSNLEAAPCCSSRRDMVTASLCRRTNCDTFFEWDADLAPPNLLPPKFPCPWQAGMTGSPSSTQSGMWELGTLFPTAKRGTWRSGCPCPFHPCSSWICGLTMGLWDRPLGSPTNHFYGLIYCYFRKEPHLQRC